MKCARFADCPFAPCPSCDGVECEDYVSPDHERLLRERDNQTFVGFVLGVVFTLVAIGVTLWAKGAL